MTEKEMCRILQWDYIFVLNQELIQYRYSSCCFFIVGVTTSKKCKAPLFYGLKFGKYASIDGVVFLF